MAASLPVALHSCSCRSRHSGRFPLFSNAALLASSCAWVIVSIQAQGAEKFDIADLRRVRECCQNGLRVERHAEDIIIFTHQSTQLPGVGSLLVTAIQSNDYNVVIALSFIYSAMYIGIMLAVDILYGIIDPRIRVAKEGDN